MHTFCADYFRVVRGMAETSSLVAAHRKLLKLPDHSELVMIPSISIQKYSVFPERNNSSVDETTDEMFTDYCFPTEQTSNDLVAVTHSRIPVLPAKSELVVPQITLHCEQPSNNEET